MVPAEIYRTAAGDTSSPLDRQLDKLADLIGTGRKAEAIEFYIDLFGVEPAEAEEAVENLAAKNRRPADLPPTVSRGVPVLAEPDRKRSVSGGWRAILLIAVPLLLLAIIIPVLVLYISMNTIFVADEKGREDSLFDLFEPASTERNRSGSTGTARTAEKILEFGGEGIGAGNFKDNRDVGIDGDGNIYSADYLGNRIQKFSPEGKFLSQIKGDGKVQFRNLAVNREGDVFVLNSNQIHKYDSRTGKLVKKIGGVIIWDLETDLDGNLVAVDNRGNVMRYDKNLRRTAFYRNLTGKAEMEKGFYELAVNGLDEIFMITTFKNEVFKFSKDGKFLDRFKVDAMMPQRIMVDGQNRIFVSDVSKILIYDGDGKLIDSFPANQAFGVKLNDRGELYVAERPYIRKYKLNL